MRSGEAAVDLLEAEDLLTDVAIPLQGATARARIEADDARRREEGLFGPLEIDADVDDITEVLGARGAGVHTEDQRSHDTDSAARGRRRPWSFS